MHLDQHDRLPLLGLSPKAFETFCFDFFLSGVFLRVKHDGAWLEATVKEADTYASASGMKQDGIDLRLHMDSGNQWVVQCKKVRKFGLSEARKAVENARDYQARHFLLLVAGDTTAKTQAFIDEQGNWTLWNLDRICTEVRRQVAPERLPKLLHFLSPEQVREFAPWRSKALVSPPEFFKRTLGREKRFRHDWRMVGRTDDLAALSAFAKSPEKKVFVLVSKGGDGKSRLLWEFSRDFTTRHRDAEVRFFNPNSDDPIDLALLSSARPLVIVVDDAHREVVAATGQGQNPRFGQLLDAIRELPHARLVLSTRPHAVTALLNRISEAGLSEVRDKPRSLSRLNRTDVRALAEQALGPKHRELAEALLKFTRDSPFMTVMAGEFVRLGDIVWGTWTNEAGFRREVFRRFEEDNLKGLRKADRTLGGKILRLSALLAPVPATSDFFASAASVLATNAIEIEQAFWNLQQAELLVGFRDAMRVAPDLFGDFLVFSVCFEPKMKLPVFVRTVLEAFSGQSPTLLQNLAEAAWVAEASGIRSNEQMAPLIEAERMAFREESFHRRAARLVRWQNFGVYLPRQSLALAKLAFDLKTAPPDKTLAEWLLPASDELDTHNYVLGKISPLVAPIATYHDAHRHAALDLLWRLGTKRIGTQARLFDSAEPDETIAQVIAFAAGKSVAVTLDSLDWLQRKLTNEENLRRILERPSLLSAWLRPCFERFVELDGREGARIWFEWREVSVENTKPVRQKALDIIRQVISSGPWQAALAGISALGNAVHRVSPSDIRKAEDGETMRERWRSERLEGLDTLHLALECHDHFLVHYAVRALLRHDLVFEEDPEFKRTAQTLAYSVKSNLDFRLTSALIDTGDIEFFDDDDGAGRKRAQIQRARERRNQTVQRIAAELLDAHPDNASLLSHLVDVSRELRAGHYTPTFHRLFAGFVLQAPQRAVELARCILSTPSDNGIASHFLALIDENPAIDSGSRIEFLRSAAKSAHADLGSAVVRDLTWHADRRSLSKDEKSLLFDCARDPTPHEFKLLLEFVRWARGPALDWATEVIPVLPLERLAHGHTGQLLEALTPEGASPDQLPTHEFIEAVLSRLVAAPEIDSEHLNEITGKYPRQTFDFLLARLRFAETAGKQYRATPRDRRLALDLRSLTNEPDYSRLCEELWRCVLATDNPRRSDWVRLFQAVVLHEPSGWSTRLLTEIKRSRSLAHLRRLIDLLHFNGSLIVFRFPEITRAFLVRADELGNSDGGERIRRALYAISGPATRGYTSGALNPEDDYLEAEALKSAERYRNDPLLGPFYRWLVECEQKDRQWHHDDHAASMAELEDM